MIVEASRRNGAGYDRFPPRNHAMGGLCPASTTVAFPWGTPDRSSPGSARPRPTRHRTPSWAYRDPVYRRENPRRRSRRCGGHQPEAGSRCRRRGDRYPGTIPRRRSTAADQNRVRCWALAAGTSTPARGMCKRRPRGHAANRSDGWHTVRRYGGDRHLRRRRGWQCGLLRLLS